MLLYFFLTVTIMIKIDLITGETPYPAASYYWSMTATNRTHMIDEEFENARADLYGVQFTKVRKIGYAASLNGQTQWIDVDAGDVRDCLAFQFSSCYDDHSIAVAFWIRIRSAKRIFATGSYTNSTKGPGILLQYDDITEMIKAEFASLERHWSVQLRVPRNSWCHITASWTIESGLIVVLDGHYDDLQSIAVDVRGKKDLIRGKLFTKMITIGRPRNIADLKGYGNFDIAHLVVYFRSITDIEIKEFPTIPLKGGSMKDLECCNKKQNDKCYNTPCYSRSCERIEEKYTDCVCVHLKHNKCKAYTSTSKPVLSISYKPTSKPALSISNNVEVKTKIPIKPNFCGKFTQGMLPGITGCANKMDATGKPYCNTELCYYGICRNTNRIYNCFCPESDTCKDLPSVKVCGSDGMTYANLCLLKRVACRRERPITMVHEGFCLASIKNATHYWPFNEGSGIGIAKKKQIDKNGHNPALLHNTVSTTTTRQLGNAVKLDGKNDWIEIKDLDDPCISRLECPNGLSVGFWINFEKGDYILAAGGYADRPSNPPGFRLKRDKQTGFYKLEVGTTNTVWQIYIYKFPNNWFHFSFTWSLKEGLKLYFNGEERLTNNDPLQSQSKRNLKSLKTNSIVLAMDDERTLRKLGKFQIAHLAIWTKRLDKKDIEKAYAANVNITVQAEVCCQGILDYEYVKDRCGKYKFTEQWKKIKEIASKCICPDIKLNDINRHCLFPPVGEMKSPGICANKISNCSPLIKRQDGFCASEEAEEICASSCGHCVPNVLASVGPKKHFSQETLIFSMLGCIGGLILLLGITVYFWKIYRTRRYHGAFVPPVKTVSLLDVSDYDEEKWPNKYIDSAAYFIKDVPPKKRALPLIPARSAQASHRYQPPDFD